MKPHCGDEKHGEGLGRRRSRWRAHPWMEKGWESRGGTNSLSPESLHRCTVLCHLRLSLHLSSPKSSPFLLEFGASFSVCRHMSRFTTHLLAHHFYHVCIQSTIINTSTGNFGHACRHCVFNCRPGTILILYIMDEQVCQLGNCTHLKTKSLVCSVLFI